MRIIHIADVHWRGLSRHEEYILAFKDFFKKAKKIKVFYIPRTQLKNNQKTQGKYKVLYLPRPQVKKRQGHEGSRSLPERKSKNARKIIVSLPPPPERRQKNDQKTSGK